MNKPKKIIWIDIWQSELMFRSRCEFNKPYVFKILINSCSRFDYQRLTKQRVYIQTRTCVFSPKECLLSLRFGICISNNKRCSSLSIFSFYIMVGWRWNQLETLGVRIFFHSSLRPSHFVITVKKIQFRFLIYFIISNTV